MQTTVALAVALWIGGASAAETWRVSEIAFESAGRGDAAVEMDAVFEFGDCKLRIPSFWDGGKSFKTRFAPPKAGEWKWRTECAAEPSLDGKEGVLQVEPYSGDLELYRRGFVKAYPQWKCFTYADGSPFFYLGDTHWGFGREAEDDAARPEERHVETVARRRVEQGFTVWQSEPIGCSFDLTDGTIDEKDIAGFRIYDRAFQTVADAGLVHANAQFFFPQQIKSQLAADTNALRRLSRYWVARYGAYPVMWTLGQEVDNDMYYPKQNKDWKHDANPYVKIAEYIHVFDAYSHPLTAHQENTGETTVTGAGTAARASAGGRSIFADENVAQRCGHNWWGAQWSPKLNGAQNVAALKDYWKDSRIPVNYEGRYCGLWALDFGARAQAWISLLSGFRGHGYGAADLWLFKSTYDMAKPSRNEVEHISVEMKHTPWRKALEFDSANQMRHFRRFFSRIAWWRLEPDFGEGKFFKPAAGVSGAYACAAMGKTISIVYFFGKKSAATGNFIGLHPGAKYSLERFNPRTGAGDTLGDVAASSEGFVAVPPRPDTEDWVYQIMLLNHSDKIRAPLPIIDFTKDARRQTVIAAGTDKLYQGHPTTVRTGDGKSIYCVWCIGHGGPCGPMAVSRDDGLTWERVDERMPKAYSTVHANCPTLQRLVTKDGEERLFVFSSKKAKLGSVMSRDGGKTWAEVPAADLSSGMPPTGFLRLKDGTSALFGQIRSNPQVKTDGPTDDQDVWMSVTADGGMTWSPARVVAHKADKNLCEPFAIRSPDGSEIALIMRENRHTGTSMMAFSRDEGKTWTEPADTCWGLTGDRHQGVRLPDGRWFIAFRDRAIGSSTYGQYVAWVGTYGDLRNARPGQCRVHLLRHHGVPGVWPGNEIDTGYSGVELLPDGTVLCTTYTRHWADERLSSVVMTRFNVSELPKAGGLLVFNEDNSAYGSGCKYGGAMTEQGLRDYVKEITKGGKVSHFFMCPNAMCVNWDSKVMEPIWAAFDRPGAKTHAWQEGVKKIHDAGIDMYAVWVEESRKQGISPWLTIRMNDVHCADDPNDGMHSKFWREHPEFRRNANKKVSGGWTAFALDYSHKEVRDYWTAFLGEAFARYDVDGVELDWLRFADHLPPGKEREHSWCLDEVVKAARGFADTAAKRLGHPVLVGARVASRPETAREHGTDFEKWAKEGWIDWLVPCNFWSSVDFYLPFAEWKRLLAAANPKVFVLPGMDGGATVKGKRHFLSLGEYSVFADRMYKQGAPGVYLFNLFDCPKTNGVWNAILSEGLPPSVVSERAKGVQVTSEHD